MDGLEMNLSPPASEHTAAVLVPYRDRADELAALVPELTSFLERSGVSFHIYVLEQTPGKPFNKGKLLNVGVRSLPADSTADYLVVHDVDMVPTDGRADYSFPPVPRQLYGPWQVVSGGVFAIRRDHYRSVNGFGNQFWGWGWEDCDMDLRLVRAGFSLEKQFHRRSAAPPFRETSTPTNKSLFSTLNLDTYEPFLRYRRHLADPGAQRADGLAECVFEVVGRRHLGPRCTQLTVEL
jgi:hypothetical protein